MRMCTFLEKVGVGGGRSAYNTCFTLEVFIEMMGPQSQKVFFFFLGGGGVCL